MQPPAVGLRPGVGADALAFERQRMRDDAADDAGQRQRGRLEQRGALALDQRRVQISRRERARADDAAQEGDVRLHADDVRLRQRRVEPRERLCAVVAER